MVQFQNIRTIAVFSDIHSNYHAFRACFEDALVRGAEAFIFLGDFVSDLAGARQTMDLVYEIQSCYPTRCLRGNRERYLLEHRKGCFPFCPGSKTGSLLYTYQQLQPRDLDLFQSLPTYQQIQFNGLHLELAHSLRDNDRQLFTPEDSFIQEVFDGMDTPLLLTGHAHAQYICTRHGKTIINPGSIGVPRGFGNWAQYALLHIENGGFQCQFRQLPYNLKATVQDQFSSGLVKLAPYWAIGILYDIITGKEYAVELLENVTKSDGLYDESAWRRGAEKMGMKFTEAEIIALIHQQEAIHAL